MCVCECGSELPQAALNLPAVECVARGTCLFFFVSFRMFGSALLFLLVSLAPPADRSPDSLFSISTRRPHPLRFLFPHRSTCSSLPVTLCVCVWGDRWALRDSRTATPTRPESLPLSFTPLRPHEGSGVCAWLRVRGNGRGGRNRVGLEWGETSTVPRRDGVRCDCAFARPPARLPARSPISFFRFFHVCARALSSSRVFVCVCVEIGSVAPRSRFHPPVLTPATRAVAAPRSLSLSHARPLD